MAKFILLYRGPATPMEDITPENSEQIMQAWGAWMGKVGDALVDGGAPFAGRTAVAGDGSVTSASDLNGYTIVDAPDIDTAKTLCDGNPFVSDGTAKFAIEIYELVPM
jgi:YCII-related domain